MQDAANLGWKLAAAVQGWGGDRLLDSYHTERYPVGRQVLRSSGTLIRLALIRPRWGRAARALLGRILMAVPPITDRVGGMISGIGIRYPARHGADPRVGTRMPDIALAGGRMHEALRGGRFVLVGPSASTVTLPAQVDAAAPAQPTGELTGELNGEFNLVRPDGYVAWVGAPEQFPAWAREYYAAGPGVTTPAAAPSRKRR